MNAETQPNDRLLAAQEALARTRKHPVLRGDFRAVLGPAGGQVELSLAILNAACTDDTQRFHLRQIENVLCVANGLPEEDEP